MVDTDFPDTEMEERLDEGCVLIAGGGPVGLVLATTLSYYGVRSVVLERNDTTTRYESHTNSLLNKRLI